MLVQLALGTEEIAYSDKTILERLECVQGSFTDSMHDPMNKNDPLHYKGSYT